MLRDVNGLTAWSAAASSFAFGGDAVLWLTIFLWIERVAPSVTVTFVLNNLGYSDKFFECLNFNFSFP